MVTEEARAELDLKKGQLNEALLNEDELGMIVRAHLHIEREVTEFIRARLSPPEALPALDLEYSGRVKLALALGLSCEFKKALNFVGTLRNKFAHQLDAKITKQDANNFEDALGAHVSIIQTAYHDTHRKLKTENTAPPLKQKSPKDRVTLYLVTLWGGIAVETAYAQGRIKE